MHTNIKFVIADKRDIPFVKDFLRTHKQLELISLSLPLLQLLAAKHNIFARSISSGIFPEVASSYIEDAWAISEQVCQRLDEIYGQLICKHLNTPVYSYFFARYSYEVHLIANAYLVLMATLGTEAELLSDVDLVVTRTPFDTSLGKMSLAEILPELGIKCRVLPIAVAKTANLTTRRYQIFISKVFWFILSTIWSSSGRRRLLNQVKAIAYRWLSKTIFLRKPLLIQLGELGNFEELFSELVKYRLVTEKKLPYVHYQEELDNIHTEAKVALSSQQKESLPNKISNLLLKQIIKHFLDSIDVGGDFSHLYSFHRITADELYKPIGGIWGFTPVGYHAAVAGYLIANGKEVLGYQHGGFFGNQHNQDVCRCELPFCSQYITYGFTESDIKKIYPNIPVKTKLHPFGTLRRITKRSAKKNPRLILYPLTNSISLFDGGMKRELPDRLHQKQMHILHYLNEVGNAVVQYWPGANENSVSVWHQLGGLKNLKIIPNRRLIDVISGFDAVILDHPSTPLYEIISLDVEIFMCLDSVLPLERNTQDMLDRRVYLANTPEQLTSWVTAYREGKLPKKRDDTFYTRTIHPMALHKQEKEIHGLMHKMFEST